MKRLVLSLFISHIIFINFLLPALASEKWPKLLEPADESKCTEALEIAKAVFYSNNFYLFEETNPDIINTSNSNLLLTRPDYPKDSDEIVILDHNIFEEVGKNDSDLPEFIFWQKEPQNGYRLVLNTYWFNWRGRWYDLYLVPEKITIGEIRKKFKEYKELDEPPIVSSWDLPLILRDEKTAALYVLDSGRNTKKNNDENVWIVYEIKEEGINQLCKIGLIPEQKIIKTSLPVEVKKLANLLDIVIGNDDGMSTSHPHGNIKFRVAQSLINLALRPWALNSELHYNTMAQIHIELKKWSKKTKYNQKLYKDIQQHYIKAQEALTKYYMNKFADNKYNASIMAAQALELFFREHFVFRSIRYQPQENYITLLNQTLNKKDNI